VKIDIIIINEIKGGKRRGLNKLVLNDGGRGSESNCGKEECRDGCDKACELWS
jgi:hypothetical protein